MTVLCPPPGYIGGLQRDPGLIVELWDRSGAPQLPDPADALLPGLQPRRLQPRPLRGDLRLRLLLGGVSEEPRAGKSPRKPPELTVKLSSSRQRHFLRASSGF